MFEHDDYGFIYEGGEYDMDTNSMETLVEVLRDDAILPAAGSKDAGAYDIYAAIDKDVYISPGENVVIGTGMAIKPPKGFDFFILARSGNATNRGLRPANCVGLCDEDYRGEYKVALYNDSFETQIIHPGDKIAQIKLTKKYRTTFTKVDKLDETERGAGGFGSTGIR